MKLDCSFTEIIKSDFGALWKCKQHDDVLEISTPFLFPNSKFVRVFITQRDDRFIVTENGDISELLGELIPHEDFSLKLQELALDAGIKKGTHDGPVFFKECADPKFITSLVLDLVSFATKAAHVILDGCEPIEEEKEKRFNTEANEYIRHIISPSQHLHTNHLVRGVPDVRFSAVVESERGLWIVSYIGGSTMKEFRMKTSDTAYSFKEAWASESKNRIRATIPVMNNTRSARGYKPQKLIGRFMELEKEARRPWITWTNRPLLEDIFKDGGN